MALVLCFDSLGLPVRTALAGCILRLAYFASSIPVQLRCQQQSFLKESIEEHSFMSGEGLVLWALL